MNHAVGVDFGTDSVRTVVFNTANGDVMSYAVESYPRWGKGLYCEPNVKQFRQHPRDHLECLEKSLLAALDKLPLEDKLAISSIGVDTTGSTPIAVDKSGIPLSLNEKFSENPDAMFILWKDHSAIQAADRITKLSKCTDVDFTKYCGGDYSPEWYWAKLLNILQQDDELSSEIYSWVEHCDWITGCLSGNSDPATMLRSRCAAGHKAMWHESHGGFPSTGFLAELHPRLPKIRADLPQMTYPATTRAGYLSDGWQKKLGLAARVSISVGGLDAHMGAVGAFIKPGEMVKVMGTSTCDMVVGSKSQMRGKVIEGISGQVEGSILPEMIGLEAGQAAFGDVYDWFQKLLCWPLQFLTDESQKKELQRSILNQLALACEEKSPCRQNVYATDWFNGRRTPEPDANRTASIHGLSLGTDAPDIFRALVEATAYGSRRILDHYDSQGIPVDSVIALGGVALKSNLVTQILADVLNRPVKVNGSEFACALGAAMCASVAAEIHSSLPIAQAAMAKGVQRIFTPDEKMVDIYSASYQRYLGAS